MKEVYPQDIQCIIDPINGKGGLYIGNLQAAQNARTLSRLGINAIISSAKGHILSHSATTIPSYLYLPAQDHEAFNISRYFEESSDFLDNFLKKTNVLVHCLAGVSRSVTLVLAYLISKQRLTLAVAYNFVKKRRSKIHPNDGFLRQLKELELRVAKDIKESKGNKQNKEYGRRSVGSKEGWKVGHISSSLNKENAKQNIKIPGEIFKKEISLCKKSFYDTDYDRQLWKQIESLKITNYPLNATRERASSKAQQGFSSIKKQLLKIQNEVQELRTKLSRPPSQPSLSRTASFKRTPLGCLNLN